MVGLTGSDVPAGGTLTVLGCDGSYPGPGGAASGYLVEHGDVVVWLDAGSGTFANLQLLADPGRVDALVLSHEHPDHWSDLESFAVWLLHARRRPFPVYAPPGLRARSFFGDNPVFAWHELEPSEQIVLGPRDVEVAAPGRAGSLACSFSVTDHGPETLAVRFDPVAGGAAVASRAPDLSRSLAYTADTGPEWSVSALGMGIGTVLSEATFTRDHEGEHHHLSGRQAGTMALAAGVGELVVTHRLPTVSAGALAAEADEAFGRPVHQAGPGRVFEW